MSAYYNEIDPYAAQWLRNLIAAGHIAYGIVDERSIEDVEPELLVGFTQCHFFAGLGAWSYALRRAGWPDARPVWTGSCPCQPFSAAGKGAGVTDERHLWPAWNHLIEQCKPPVIFGEQVASVGGLGWLDGVLTDLEGAGYSVGATDICAAGVGAPHIRQRLYWVGDTERAGLERYPGDGTIGRGAEAIGSDAKTSGCGHESASMDAVSMLRRMDMHDPQGARSRLRMSADRGLGQRSVWSEFDALACSDGWRRVRSSSFPLANGVASRVGRLRAYGNAIVAPVAEEFIRAYMI